MIITSIFQKLSLVFPVLAGLLFYTESASPTKIMAIPLTVLAIVMSNFPDRKNENALKAIKQFWYLPILVLFGSGLIEILLFYVQKSGKVGDAGLNFTSLLFVMAGIWGSLFLIIKRKFSFRLNEIIAGICIGIPNFFSIYLLIKGLDLGWDGSVLFPVNNVGTIFFTAIIGILIFKEKLTQINYVGLVLAIIAVYFISQ